MAFCGRCGREAASGDAFCQACGAPLGSPEPPVEAAPVAPTPPQPTAPPVVPDATPKRRFPVWAAVLVGLAVLALVGGAAALFALRPTAPPVAPVSSASPGSLGFDAEPFDPSALPATGSESATVPSSAATEPVATDSEPTAETATAAAVPAPRLTQAGAIDVVGRMLDFMHRGKRSQALALVTKNMLKDVSNDKTWFSPGPDILISFEVQDATKKGGTMKVRVLEQWNSGPERTTYDVVLSAGKHKVDGIKWSSW